MRVLSPHQIRLAFVQSHAKLFKPLIVRSLRESSTLETRVLRRCLTPIPSHSESEKREEEGQEAEWTALRKADLASMLDDVRQIRTTKTVPIDYAVERFLVNAALPESYDSAGKWRHKIIETLREELQIVNRKGEFFCSKQRVDAMDFHLWHYDHCSDMQDLLGNH